MKTFTATIPALLTALCLGACDRPATPSNTITTAPLPEPEAKTKTLETSRLGRAVDTYERQPTGENAADVKRAMADLDGEIAELETRVARTSGADRDEAAAKRRNLESYRTAETARFTAAQAKAPVTRTVDRVDSRSGAEKAKESAERAGNAMEDAARKTGDAIKDAVR